MNTEPNIAVGISASESIYFRLNGRFQLSQNGYIYEHEQYIELNNDKILFNGDFYDEIDLNPLDANSSFTLFNVTIGVNFHWQREEEQSFEGVLRFITEKQKLNVVNILSVEKYLTSVISSEMSATSSIALLRAHAVISRSWVLAQIKAKENNKKKLCCIENYNERIKWYDKDDHMLYDVCADDHCQRYQGITKITSNCVKEAIYDTYGETLFYDGKICDARFSKCCGGISEDFGNCWQDENHPYLTPIYDNAADTTLPSDLTIEENARAWIINDVNAFCNTDNHYILSQVLNNYDCETADFYRWKVSYTQSKISELINRRSGIDFGRIIDLQPIQRGKSGRIIKLRIIGTKRTFSIGKELEIRRILSDSHLYSSAFFVDKIYEDDTIPALFNIYGAGWGHGVGLCQIGAALMSENGYGYNQILNHYFKGAEIVKAY